MKKSRLFHLSTRKNLFTGLKVSQAGEEVLKHQGKYPVIFLSFKDVKEDTFDLTYAKISELTAKLYRRFSYLQDSPHLIDSKKNYLKLF